MNDIEPDLTSIVHCGNVTQGNLDVCCNGKKDCCDNNAFKFKLSGPGKPIKTIALSDSSATRLPATSTSSGSTTSSPSSVAAVTQTVTSIPSASPSNASSFSGLSGGGKAGVAIGVIAGVGAIVALLFLLWRRRNRQTDRAPETWAMKEDYHHPSTMYFDSNHNQRRSELSGQQESELSTGNRAHAWEMPAQEQQHR